MTRVPAVIGFLAAGVGGYLLGRREWGEVSYLRQALTTALHQRSEPVGPSLRPRAWDDETEFEHVAEQERADRHRVAEEIKHHPLKERIGGPPEDTSGTIERPELERIDRLGPRSL